MRRERALKALPRERKLALIRQQQTGAGFEPDEEAHA
jgi:predicted GIY-YIG superfamily endonuclease